MKWITATTVAASMFTSSVAVAPATEQQDIKSLLSQEEMAPADWILGQSLTSELSVYADPDAIKTAKMNAWGLEQLHQSKLDRYYARIESMMDAVGARVGKTPYVFSGASTSGWDCSGLTRWAYAKLGVNLQHSASAQLRAGVKVSKPQRGDLVVFGNGYHVGLYYSPGKMLHSGGRPGQYTEVRDISDFWGKVTYIRVIDKP